MSGKHRRSRRPARPSAKPRPILAASLIGAGVLLAGLCVFNGVSQAALFAPSPATQVSDAWTGLSRSTDSKTVASAERLARQALDRNPLQSDAVALLAALEDQKGDKPKAARLMQAAADLSRRNDVADFWLFEHYRQAGQYEKAVLHADALLRREYDQPAVEAQLYPRLLVNLNDPAMAQALAARLAKRPVWRGPFLRFTGTRLPDPGAAFVIYSAMQKAGARPTTQELDPYFRRLIAAKRYDEAYLSWVLFLPSDVVSKLDNIYDGDFQGWPEAAPFGWNLSAGGVRGSVESSEAYNRPGSALRVDYDGVGTPKLPGQLLLLTPGRYRLSGLALTANPQSAGRMQWIVTCIGAEVVLEAPPVANTGGAWKGFSAEFTVPQGCPGQQLDLRPLPNGERASIEVWYDNLVIRRLDEATEDAA